MEPKSETGKVMQKVFGALLSTVKTMAGNTATKKAGATGAALSAAGGLTGLMDPVTSVLGVVGGVGLRGHETVDDICRALSQKLSEFLKPEDDKGKQSRVIKVEDGNSLKVDIPKGVDPRAKLITDEQIVADALEILQHLDSGGQMKKGDQEKMISAIRVLGQITTC